MNLADIRSALADTLEGLSVNAYSYAPDSPNSPAAFVYPEAFQYHTVFAGGDDLVLVVRFLIASTNTQQGQNDLDQLLSSEGTGSAVAAIEADQTLAGLATSVEVTDCRNYGVLSMPDGASRYLSAELLVSIII